MSEIMQELDIKGVQNSNVLRAKRALAESRINTMLRRKTELTAAEKDELIGMQERVGEITQMLATHARMSGHDPFKEANRVVVNSVEEPEQKNGGIKAIHEWMRGRILATDTPLHGYTSPVSAGLATAIETHVLDRIATYVANDAFVQAGATVYNTEGTQPLVKPVISSGDDPDSFVEGQSATDSKPMEVAAFTFGGTKYSRLVKVSEEALMNSALDLPSEILAELGASVANKFTALITAALVSALQTNVDCFVNSGVDNFHTVQAMILAIKPRFSSANNKWMLSRADLLRIKDQRDSQGRPLFDSTSNTLGGFGISINDNLSRLVFGNWAAGAFIRKSPFVLQRLNELYSSTGHVGFKATQFVDQKFLASVSGVDAQPLVFSNNETAGS